MTAGFAGPVALVAAMAFALVGVVTGRRWPLAVAAAMSALATAVLAVALLAGDFSLGYVAETTSLATPWPYRLAALWGGMDGSMLFYSALTLAVAAAGLRGPGPTRVGSFVGFALLTIALIFANPFVVPDLPAVDGDGLLAILQHPAMIYHPPLLYLGLVVLVVPFALTMSPGPREEWLPEVRRWLYTSWVLLTIGMTAGANWAYVELGWGGFWAWDPVENTALMPWLAITVFLHTSRIEESAGRARRWNVLFASLPFALSVLGVYLTRSGVTGSIHSFAEDPAVGRVLLGAAAVTAGVVMVNAARSEPGAPWGHVKLDRLGWLGVNGALLAAVLVFLTAGSAYPAYAAVFGGATVAVDSSYFVATILPIAVVVAGSLALALRVSWPLMAGLTTVSVLAVTTIGGLRPGAALMAPALASLGLVAHRLVTQRIRGRLFTAHLAHAGMALLLVGVAGSSFGTDFTGSMRPGDSVVIGGHEITLRDVTTGDTERFLFVRARIEVDGATLEPEIRAYEDQTLPVAEPVLSSGPLADVIVAVSLLFPDGETVAVSVFVRPLVWWVWAGAALMSLAGLAALSGRAGAAAGPRRSATAGRRRAGTASGTPAR